MSDKNFIQEKRELAAKVVDRILNDVSFREALRQDPEGAMDTTFAEEWHTLLDTINDPEVAGYIATEPISGDADSNCCQGASTVCELTNY